MSLVGGGAVGGDGGGGGGGCDVGGDDKRCVDGGGRGGGDGDIVLLTIVRFEEIGFFDVALDENYPGWAEERLFANARFEYVARLMSYELLGGRNNAEMMLHILGCLLSIAKC